MKIIALYHSPHYYNDDGEYFYKCSDCLNFGIKSDYSFCPYCGNKITFQKCREYEQELFERLISRIKYRLSNIFMVSKNEDGTYNLLRKDGIEDKGLVKKSKFIIEQLLITFSTKKVYRGSVYHPIFSNLHIFLTDPKTAKQKANLIFKDFIQEKKVN